MENIWLFPGLSTNTAPIPQLLNPSTVSQTALSLHDSLAQNIDKVEVSIAIQITDTADTGASTNIQIFDEATLGTTIQVLGVSSAMRNMDEPGDAGSLAFVQNMGVMTGTGTI